MPRRGEASERKMRISSNARAIAITAILAVTILTVIWMYRPSPTKPLGAVSCPDGSSRPLIDATKFDTQYWAYSIKLEASLSQNQKLSAAIEPKLLQQLSEALQQANEFRKWLVNSYNACAIPQKEYDDYGISFQGMDNAARNLQDALDRGVHTAAERASVSALATTYVQLARGLQAPASRTNR